MTLSNLPYAGQRPVRSARRADRFHQLHAPIVYRVLEFLVDRGELLLAVDVDQRNHASAVATSTFGVIERLIDQTDGTIQRHVDRRTSYRETRAPDGHRATDALAMPHDGLAAHGTEQSMRREIQLRIAHRAQQNQELFASPAQQGLVVAQRVGKTLAGSGQHGVTRRMPERVVDALEVIHIDQQRTADERSIALLGQNPLVEVPAVAQPGQRVVLAVEAQSLIDLADTADAPTKHAADQCDQHCRHHNHLLTEPLGLQVTALDGVVALEQLDLASPALVLELRRQVEQSLLARGRQQLVAKLVVAMVDLDRAAPVPGALQRRQVFVHHVLGVHGIAVRQDALDGALRAPLALSDVPQADFGNTHVEQHNLLARAAMQLACELQGPARIAERAGVVAALHIRVAEIAQDYNQQLIAADPLGMGQCFTRDAQVLGLIAATIGNIRLLEADADQRGLISRLFRQAPRGRYLVGGKIVIPGEHEQLGQFEPDLNHAGCAMQCVRQVERLLVSQQGVLVLAGERQHGATENLHTIAFELRERSLRADQFELGLGAIVLIALVRQICLNERSEERR